jgi:hypothetical protein
LTLSVTERAFEVFRTPSADSIDPTFIILHRLYSLLRNHLPSTVQSAPHTSSLHHDHPSSDITPCVHSGARSKPEGLARRTGKSLPSDLSCSALVVSRDFDGLLHTMLAGLLHPATGHEVDDVSGSPFTGHRHTEAHLLAGPHGPSPSPHTLRRIPLSQSRTASPRPVPSCRYLNSAAAPKRNARAVGASIRPPDQAAEAPHQTQQLRGFRHQAPPSSLTLCCHQPPSQFKKRRFSSRHPHLPLPENCFLLHSNPRLDFRAFLPERVRNAVSPCENTGALSFHGLISPPRSLSSAGRSVARARAAQARWCDHQRRKQR